MSKLLGGGGRAIIPEACPLGAFENQDTRDGKTRISERSHEKIGDCEQSKVDFGQFFIFSARHQLDTWTLGPRRHVAWRDSVGVESSQSARIFFIRTFSGCYARVLRKLRPSKTKT